MRKLFMRLITISEEDVLKGVVELPIKLGETCLGMTSVSGGVGVLYIYSDESAERHRQGTVTGPRVAYTQPAPRTGGYGNPDK